MGRRRRFYGVIEDVIKFHPDGIVVRRDSEVLAIVEPAPSWDFTKTGVRLYTYGLSVCWEYANYLEEEWALPPCDMSDEEALAAAHRVAANYKSGVTTDKDMSDIVSLW